MSSTPNRVIMVLACLFVVGLCLVGALIYQQQGSPLTSIERQLVGHWLHTTDQEDDPGAGFIMLPDRTFETNDQQFYGHWEFTAGKLVIECRGVRNWGGNSWFEKLWNGMKSQPLNRNQFDVTFGEGGERLELVELSELVESKLVRAEGESLLTDAHP